MANKNKKNQQKKKPRQKASKVKTNVVTKYVERPPPSISQAMGTLGSAAMQGFGRFLGLGQYELRSNSLFDTRTSRQVPFMHSANENFTLRHREYITDISTSTTFASNKYKVNPGVADTFPYLSTIANCFQEYKFKGLVFEFKSTSATAVASTNTALGSVMLACQYRNDAADFTTKTQMLNEMWSADGKPSDDIIMPVECDPSQRHSNLLFVRSTTLSDAADYNLFDMCKFTIGTIGSQAVAVAGELWVSYEVELYKPKVL